eukprot:3585946-Amphidinium_carterae.1
MISWDSLKTLYQLVGHLCVHDAVGSHAESEDRTQRRQTWLTRMSEANMSYTAGDVKPVHNPSYPAGGA